MIPLGSCTMKLNATAEMFPISWPEISKLHPFAPTEQTVGYAEMCEQLENWLAEITGFDAISLQRNAGSQGEIRGLAGDPRVSRFARRSPSHCLPYTDLGSRHESASATMAGFKVVSVACLKDGDIDLADLRARQMNSARSRRADGDISSTMASLNLRFAKFATSCTRMAASLHGGANMNAQVGLCRPGDYGADVCHLNLHKTFCIPHGGGGPGIGPIGVARHLAPYLPREFIIDPETGRILFAKESMEKRPPSGDDSDYRHGGGKGGNVAAAPMAAPAS